MHFGKERLEVVPHFGSVRVTRVPIPFERAVDDALQLGMDALAPTGERRRILGETPRESRHVFGAVWNDSGEHLVQRDAERIDVRAPVERLAAELLGRQIGRGAENEAGLRFHEALADLRDAEVHQERPPALVEENVVGLDVAVDDAARMAVVERVQERNHDPRRRLLCERAARRDLSAERGPFHELHRVPERPFDVPEIVDFHDAGMLERGRHAGFLAEALDEVRVFSVRFVQDLECLEALEARAPHLVDGGEAAASQKAEYFIAAAQELLNHPAAVVDGLHNAC